MNLVGTRFIAGTAASVCLITLLASLGPVRPCRAQTVDTLWAEGFEGDWDSRWADDHGTWEVGTPTSGPNATHSGANLLATVLAGDYSEDVDTRFYQVQNWVVPPASEHPRVRFWHWWSFGASDYGQVQIQVAGGEWQTLETYDRHGSGRWARGYADLSAFAGQTVKLCFYFHSASSFGGSAGPGWYVDDVTVETGERGMTWPEGWEDGIGSWYADRGMWEVGVPTSGPGGAHSGSNVAATVLDGDYSEDLDCQLISPPFQVPASDENPRLRFWHWWNIGASDAGYVQIRVRGGDWQTLESYDRNGSNRWTRGFVDLAAYADSTVELAFYFHSASSFGGSAGPGWYLDDVTVETGARRIDSLTTWDGPEGIGAWYADRGMWEVGVPTSGPDSAYSGTNVAATILDGDYSEDLDCRLISPPFRFDAPAGSTPCLRFRNWYSLGASDAGYVQARIGNGAWTTLENGTYTGSSGASSAWSSHPYFDMSAYNGDTVQVCFYFASRSSFGGSAGPGWYVDDVQLDYAYSTPVLVSLVNADVIDGDFRLTWFLGGGQLPSAVVYRSLPGAEWVRIGDAATDGAGYLRFVDHPDVAAGTLVGYRLGIVEAGLEGFYGETWVAMPPVSPVALALGAHPNPSSGGPLSVTFSLPTSAPAQLEVVDVSGRRVMTREVGDLGSGRHVLDFGRDQRLAPGVYLVRLTQGASTRSTRVSVFR